MNDFLGISDEEANRYLQAEQQHGQQQQGQGFLGVTDEQAQRWLDESNEQDPRMRTERRRAAGEQTSTGEFLARRSLPGGSALINLTDDIIYSRARGRVRRGQPGPDDFREIADYERRQQLDRERQSTYWGGLGDVAARLPAMAGEAYAGGAAVRGLRGAAPTASTFIGRAAQSVGTRAGLTRLAATTATMPSMYLEQGAQRNIAADRDPLDPRGMAPAFGLGMINVAALETVGVFGNNASTPLRGYLQRALGGTAVSAQASHVASGAVGEVLHAMGLGERTGFGPGESFARAIFDPENRGQHLSEGMRGLSADALTFSAFAFMHGRQREARALPDAIREYVAEVEQHHRRQGLSPEAAQTRAVEQASRVIGTIGEQVAQNPEASRQDVQTAELPARERRLAQAVASTLPERPEAPRTAPEPQGGQRPPNTPEAATERQQRYPQHADDMISGTAEFLGIKPKKGRRQLSREEMVDAILREPGGRALLESGRVVEPQAQEPQRPATYEPVGEPEMPVEAPRDAQRPAEAPAIPELLRQGGLSAREVDVLMASRVGEQSLAQVGKSMGLSKEGVRKVLARAEEKAREAPGLAEIIGESQAQAREVSPAEAKVQGLTGLPEGRFAQRLKPRSEETRQNRLIRKHYEAKIKEAEDAARAEGASEESIAAARELSRKAKQALRELLRELQPEQAARQERQEAAGRDTGATPGPGAGAGDAEARAAARPRQQSARSVLSEVKRPIRIEEAGKVRTLSGIDEASAREIGWDVEAMRSEHETMFTGHKGRKGNRNVEEVAQGLVNEDILHPRQGELAVNALERVLMDPVRGGRIHSEADLRREEAEYYRNKPPEQVDPYQGKGDAYEAPSGGFPTGADVQVEGVPFRSTQGPMLDPRGGGRFGMPPTEAERGVLPGGGQETGGTPRPQSETALANVKVDAERVRNSLPPLMSEARRANPEVWDQAMARLDADPQLAERLVAELAERSRATTVDENAILLHRKISLRNEHNRAMLEYIESSKRKAPPEELASMDRREADLLGKIDQLDRVTRETGTEWGRAGQFRRQLAREDFSLSSMLMQAERAKGSQLTEAERLRVEEQHREVSAAREDLAGAESGERPSGDMPGLRIRDKTAREDFANSLAAFRDANKSWTQSIYSGLHEASRLIMTGVDLPPLLRQGGIQLWTAPIRSARAFWEGMRSLASENAYQRNLDALEQRRLNHPYREVMKDMLTEAGRLHHQEEAFMGKIIDRMRRSGYRPIRVVGEGLRAVERGYVGYLNRLRMDAFDAYMGGFTPEGRATIQEAAALAHMAQASTGRGSLGPLEKHAGLLTHGLFSPRWLAANFQMISGQPMWGGTSRTRAIIARQYAKYIGAMIGMYSLARIFGNKDDVDLDPRSGTFGQVRVGSTRVNPIPGVSQSVVFTTRMATGEAVGRSGERPLRPFMTRRQFVDAMQTGEMSRPWQTRRGSRARDSWDVIADFVRGRGAPIPAGFVDMLTGETIGREPVRGPHNVALRWATPLAVEDVYKALRAEGIPKGTALSALILVGAGSQQHRTPR